MNRPGCGARVLVAGAAGALAFASGAAFRVGRPWSGVALLWGAVVLGLVLWWSAAVSPSDA